MLLSTIHTVKTVYQRTWWFPILRCWYSGYTRGHDQCQLPLW